MHLKVYLKDNLFKILNLRIIGSCPLRAKRVGEFIEIRHKKNITHPYTEYPWVFVTLQLCDSVTLRPFFCENDPYLN